MARLESADEFIAQVKNGKYENKVNAQRGAGRTRLSDKEKEKISAYLDQHFGSSADDAPKTGKKTSKKVAKKKKASKKVTTRASTPPPAPAVTAPTAVEEETSVAAKPGKKKKKVLAKKKVTSQAKSKPAPGTLPISPKEADSVADVLQVIDGTVNKSVSIINALKTADELSKSGDITKVVETVKKALEGAAHLLHQSVVAPLAHAGAHADPEVAARLEQVVAASAPLAAQMPESYVPPQAPASEGLPS